MRLSVVTPVGNEANALPEFLEHFNQQISGRSFNVVCHMITDSNVRDGSARMLEACEERFPWLDHSHIRGTGLAGAYIHGYKLALEAGADYVIELDVGHPIRMLPDVVQGLLDYDAVFCTRFHVSGGYVGSWKRRWISRLSTILFNFWLGTNLADATSGLHGFKREILADVNFDDFISKGHDFQSELKYVVGMKTDKIVELPFVYVASASSFSPKQLILAAKTLLNLRRVHGRK